MSTYQPCTGTPWSAAPVGPSQPEAAAATPRYHPPRSSGRRGAPSAPSSKVQTDKRMAPTTRKKGSPDPSAQPPHPLGPLPPRPSPRLRRQPSPSRNGASPTPREPPAGRRTGLTACCRTPRCGCFQTPGQPLHDHGRRRLRPPTTRTPRIKHPTYPFPRLHPKRSRTPGAPRGADAHADGRHPAHTCSGRAQARTFNHSLPA